MARWSGFTLSRLAIAAAALALPLFRGPALYARLSLNNAFIDYARVLLNDPAGLANVPAHQALVQAYDHAMTTAPALRQSTRYQVLPMLISGSAPALPAICPPLGESSYLLQVLERAQAYVQSREYGNAEALYTWLADSCPDSFEVLTNWAVLKEAQGDYGAGIRLLQTAVSLVPQFRSASNIDQPQAFWRDSALAEAYADLGDLLAKNGEVDQAITAVERAIELHPPGTESKWQYQYLGILYYQAGQLDKAKQAFEAALALDPGLPDAITYLQRIEDQQAATP